MAEKSKPETKPAGAPERIAKVMARAGVASRREAEAMIAAGRVELNGKRLDTPAVTVGASDEIRVDGKPLPRRQPARLWRYHKPKGLVTTNRDEQGRATIFERLPEDLPRVITVGRLDIATEGLLLLTNDGELARYLELPDTGWLRRYRVRAFGRVDQAALDTLRKGPSVEGVKYGSVVARIERQQGDNLWLTVDLREGKNREVKRVLASIGLDVNRLIRVSYGPFTLEDMERGEVREVPRRVLYDQVPERFRQGSRGGVGPSGDAARDEAPDGKRPHGKPMRRRTTPGKPMRGRTTPDKPMRGRATPGKAVRSRTAPSKSGVGKTALTREPDRKSSKHSDDRAKTHTERSAPSGYSTTRRGLGEKSKPGSGSGARTGSGPGSKPRAKPAANAAARSVPSAHPDSGAAKRPGSRSGKPRASQGVSGFASQSARPPSKVGRGPNGRPPQKRGGKPPTRPRGRNAD